MSTTNQNLKMGLMRLIGLIWLVIMANSITLLNAEGEVVHTLASEINSRCGDGVLLAASGQLSAQVLQRFRGMGSPVARGGLVRDVRLTVERTHDDIGAAILFAARDPQDWPAWEQLRIELAGDVVTYAKAALTSYDHQPSGKMTRSTYTFVGQFVPVISGDPYPGETLTSTMGGQWFRNGAAIEGAVGASYEIPWSASLGEKITQPGSNTITVSLNPVALVMRFNVEAEEEIVIPGRNIGAYSGVVRWGDGNFSEFSTYNDANLAHVFSASGNYDVEITGEFPAIQFANSGTSKDALVAILQWGEALTNAAQLSAFYGCGSLSALPANSQRLNTITHGGSMFRASGVTTIPEGVTFAALQDGLALFYLSSLSSLPDSLQFNALQNGQSMFRDTNLADLPTGVTLPALSNGTSMFTNVTLPTPRYSQLLIDLDSGNANSSVIFAAGNSKYSAGAAATARANLIGKGWTITDGGIA